MNPTELLRLVDAIHRDRNIEKEIVFEGIEAAFVTAAKKYYGESEEIDVKISRTDGQITATHNGTPLDAAETIGRIGAQTAKQVMIQKIREAERDSQFDKFNAQKGQLVTGVVQRFEGNKAIVSINQAEAILPRSEQIPGESHHPNERVRATIAEVRKQGNRVQIVLSRTRNDLVRRLFEQEIPEIGDGVIEIKSIAREVGYRTKVAVHSVDQRVDCVGACVGVRGNRIKNVVDELGGERIDIVRWSEQKQEFIANALQPAEVEEVILCEVLGRAIVLVAEDQLSLAIGKRGQNVRLASKLCMWDIDIMTREELSERIDRAVAGFSTIEGVSGPLAERLVGEGFLSYDDLSVIEPDDLMAMGDIPLEQVEAIVEEAERRAAQHEQQVAEERKAQKERERAGYSASAASAAAPAVALDAGETLDLASMEPSPEVLESGSLDPVPAGDVPDDEFQAEKEATADGEGMPPADLPQGESEEVEPASPSEGA
ncbi:MAG TPA: transcription termination factor NusA [Pirellulales bacterium]